MEKPTAAIMRVEDGAPSANCLSALRDLQKDITQSSTLQTLEEEVSNHVQGMGVYTDFSVGIRVFYWMTRTVVHCVPSNV